MRRGLLSVGVLAGVGLLIGVAIVVYILVSGGSGEASAPISAPELASTDDDLITFRIVSGESKVRFLIDEILRGQPTTAVGETNQVAGDIAVDVERPANSRMGTIRINVRTLETDNAFRDRAIRSQILMSARDEFEFAEFAATAITGLPVNVVLGEPVAFSVVGQLTLRDRTREVVFQATVTPVSQGRLQGTAQATVMRSDFDLTIPQVPSVADVSDEVRVEIDFVAVAIE